MPDQDSLYVLEQVLRARRPDADLSLLRAIGSSLRKPSCRRGALRRAVAAGAMTAMLFAALGATDSLSYAADSAVRLGMTAETAATAHRSTAARKVTAGSDQYQPGFGFGDPEHNHDGPPGLDIAKHEAAETPAPAVGVDAQALAKLVGASISFDEQVHLYISVVDSTNRRLLLTQSSKRGGSKVGSALAGPQTKVIQYAVLVPRTIPIQLRVPANLLDRKLTYRIRVVAVDPQGNRSTVLIPFHG
jgi:hypothetical protein